MTQLQLYFIQIPEITPKDLEDYLYILDESERMTYFEYRVNFKKIEFLIGRILLKTLAAQQLLSKPEKIRFIKNQYGKLFLHPDHGASNIFFNITHTDNMVACVFFNLSQIGVDVEQVSRDAIDVMEAVFVQEEIAFVNTNSSLKERLNAFYFIWTRKEAVMKANSKGFSLNPLSFSVPIEWGGTEDSKYYYYSTELLTSYCCSIAVTRLVNMKRPKCKIRQIDFKDIL